MFLIVSPLAHMITTGGRKWKTQIRSSSRTSGNSLLSMNAARDSDPSCPPSVATNMTMQTAIKLISQTADRRQVPNTERLPTPLSPLKIIKESLCVILSFFTPAMCGKFWLEISSTAYIHRVNCNHKALLLLLSGHKTIWRWRIKVIQWHYHFNFHSIEQFGVDSSCLHLSCLKFKYLV